MKRRPQTPLAKKISELAIEVQRRRSRQTKKVGGHLTEFGPRQEFISLLQHQKLASLPNEQIILLQRIAGRFDSVSLNSRFFQNKLQAALKRTQK